jgi:hypothetical protein
MQGFRYNSLAEIIVAENCDKLYQTKMDKIVQIGGTKIYGNT